MREGWVRGAGGAHGVTRPGVVQVLPRHHADPDQSGGPPAGKGPDVAANASGRVRGRVGFRVTSTPRSRGRRSQNGAMAQWRGSRRARPPRTLLKSRRSRLFYRAPERGAIRRDGARRGQRPERRGSRRFPEPRHGRCGAAGSWLSAASCPGGAPATATGAPPGSASTSLNPRERRVTREIVT